MATERKYEDGSDPRPSSNGEQVAQDGPLERLEFDPSQALESIARTARDHPHLALVGATAVGFILGGGLTPRMLGAMGLMAARYYLRQTIGETLESMTPR
jgi:hypothetical protein